MLSAFSCFPPLRPKLKPVEREQPITFKFNDDIEKLAAPVVQLDNVSFRYEQSAPDVFVNIDCNCDSDSRVCIVCSFCVDVVNCFIRLS